MKKRILSLLLVVVMLTLTLASCAYSYSKDDMSKYTTVDFEAFKKALMGEIAGDEIKVVDGDYTTDAEINKAKTLEKIFKDFSTLADADEKVTEGAIALYDVLYYSYYITASFDVEEGEGENKKTVEKEVVLHSSFMKEASATKVQLGTTPTVALDATKAIMTEQLAAKITEAIKDKDIKDFIYSTDVATDVLLKTEMEVYVSYTSEQGSDKTTVTYKKITLGDDAFSQKIITDCKNVGKKASFEIGEGDAKVSYKDVVVECIINSANELGDGDGFKITDYYKDDGKTPALAAVDGNTYELSKAKDGITVHVYPVYFLDTPDFDAKTLLDLVYGAGLTVDSFDAFKDESFKTADGKKLADLITELATLCKDRDTAETKLTDAKKAYDTAKSAVDKAGESATDAQKTTLETATKTKTDAETKLTETQTKVDNKISEITAIEGVEAKLIEEYTEANAEYLKGVYDAEIYEKVAVEVWELIEKYVTVNSRPEKALKEAKKNILETHKATFYTGTKSQTEGSYYKVYNGDFKAYLIDTLAKGKTYDDALAVIATEAEAHVDTMLRIHAIAELYNCELSAKKDFQAAYDMLPIVNPDYNEQNAYYYALLGQELSKWLTYAEAVYYYGEDSVHTTVQFNQILYTILELDRNEEGDKAGQMKDYITFGDELILPFKNINYTTTEETSEDTEG